MNSISNWKFTTRMICTLPVVTIKIKFSAVWKIHFEWRYLRYISKKKDALSVIRNRIVRVEYTQTYYAAFECFSNVAYLNVTVSVVFTFVFEFYAFWSALTYTVHVPRFSHCSRWISIWRIVTVIISRRMLYVKTIVTFFISL